MKNKKVISKSLSYLFKTISKKETLLMILALFSMATVGYLINYPAIALGNLINLVITNLDNGIAESSSTIITILLVLMFAEILNIIRKYIVERIATNLEQKQYVSVVSNLLRADTTVLHNFRMGGVTVKIHRSVAGIVQLLKISFMDFFPIIMISIMAFILSAENVYVPIIMLTVTVTSFYITKKQIESQDGIRRQLFSKKENIGAEISEKLTNIEYVKTSGNVDKEIQKMAVNSKSLSDTEFVHHKAMMKFDFVKNLIEILGFIAVIFVSIIHVKSGLIQAGSVLTFAMLYKSFTTPLKELHRIIDEGYEACMTVEDLIELNEIKKSRNIQGNHLLTTDDMVGNNIIDIKGLSVTFKGSDQQLKILNNISLKIFKGQKVGFAGESGSGKTTLVKAIAGLVDSFSGSVNLWGKNILDIEKNILSDYMSYLPQVTPIFNGTVKDNILYPVQNNNSNNIEQAALEAKFTDVINKMEKGLDNRLNEGGKNMSGGEKQRLLLTTLFIKKPQIAILDESTSALDSITQDSIQKSIAKLGQETNQTLLVIAHRLKMLKDMDIIYVLKEGVIIEKGSYDDLIKNENSYFSELASKESI